MGRKVEGYFTVETALVLPIVLGTIVFIIYAQLYWYDRCLMDQELAMLAMQAAKTYQGDMKQTADHLKEWKEQNITDKYFGWEKDRTILSKKSDRIILWQSGRILSDHTSWNASVQYENRILDPAAFLRLCRKCGLMTKEERG